MATVEQVISRYPRLYHMAERNSWSSIRKQGLLSTTALLDLFEVSGRERSEIESCWRPRSVAIEHAIHGVAAIRDQRPMPPGGLGPILDDVTPADWYRLVNRKAFFWLSRERLQRLLEARLYRDRVHDVLVVDTRAMLDRHLDRITLASFNTGVAVFGRRERRGANTFRRVQDFPLDSETDEAVELAVDYAVYDISDLAVSVEQRRGGSLVRQVWQR